MKKKLLLSLMVLTIFFLIPFFNMGAIWASNVGLLSHDAVVLGSNEPTIDRYMATALKSVYGTRIQVADGTADDVQLNAATTAVAALNGGSILARGSFTLSDNWTLTTNITARGLGQSKTVLTLADGIDDNVIQAKNSSNITVSDMMLDGNKNGNEEMGDSADAVHNGIYLNSVVGGEITRVTSRQNVFHGIHLTLSSNITVHNNIFQNNRFRGIINQKGSSGNFFAFNRLISNGIRTNYNGGTYGGTTNGGLCVSMSGNYNTAYGNLVLNDQGNSGAGAIEIGTTYPDDSPWQSYGNRIESNTVTGGATTTGIRLWGSTGGQLFDTYVLNNVVNDGIGLYLDTVAATRLFVEGNKFISDYTNAISYTGAVSISKSRIQNNDLYANSGQTVVKLSVFSNGIISGNHIDGYGNVQAMSLENSDNNDIFGNRFFNNTLAFSLDAASTGNRFHDNYGSSVSTDPGATFGASTTIYRNTGINYVTENSGSFSILAGATSTNITHGLDYTPAIGDITVTSNATMGSASYLYVDTIGATIFIIHANTDPVSANITGGWSAKK